MLLFNTVFWNIQSINMLLIWRSLQNDNLRKSLKEKLWHVTMWSKTVATQPLDIQPGVRLLDHTVILFFFFLRNAILFSISVCTNLYLNQQFCLSNQYLRELSARPCSLQHYIQLPRYGNNLCPLMDESKK